MNKLGIYGAGGLGREVLELARLINLKEKRWKEILFIVDGSVNEAVNGVQVYDYGIAKDRFKDELEVSVAIGEPISREKIYDKLEKDNIPLATLIHPEVHVPDTTYVGKGVTIQYGCFISCSVTINDGVFIQPQANIGHDDILKKGCVISGFANLAGHVSIGEYTYVGISACIREDISVGDWSIVGMASAVHKDIPDMIIAMGNPARPMKKNENRHVFS